MNRNKKITYDLLTKYRTQLMGIAMIGVIFFHIDLPLPYFLSKVKDIGYGAVDIFIFLSGMAIYMSLNKNNDSIQFYKKRILRIFPKYMPIVFIFSLILIIKNEITIPQFLMNITSLGFWIRGVFDVKGVFNWYIPGLLFLYLITPIYYKLFNDSKNKEICTIIAVISSIVMCLMVKEHLLIIMTRIGIYLIGILFGYYIKSEKDFMNYKIKYYIVAMILGFIGLHICMKYFSDILWSTGVCWYPYILITPPLCIFLSYLFQCIQDKMKFLDQFLSFFGKNSLEIYLCHVSFMDLFYQTWMEALHLTEHKIIYNFVSVVLTIAVAMILKEIDIIIRNQLKIKQFK